MGGASFTWIDHAVLLATLGISILIGVYYGIFKKQTTNADLLVGGRSMPVIPTALSLLATYMSPILVLGYAGEIYSYGTLMYETVFSSIVIVPIAAWIFMPTLYNLKLTSAYQYLEYRFDSVVVRFLAAGTFITQITLYMGVVLFAPALALNAVVDFPIWIAVTAMGLCCAVYTSIGGLRAVVVTDCFQMAIMLAGMFAIIIVGIIKVGGIEKVYEINLAHDRLQFLKFELDPFQRLNSVNVFVGHAVMVLGICGCQQTAVQRYCSMSTLKKGVLTLLITLPLVVFTVSLAAIAGVVIFAIYAGCDPISLGFIKRNDQIAPHFVLEYLSPTSGLMGLFISCLFAASLSTVSSGLNSVTAVTFEDFLSKISYFQKMSDVEQGRVSKLLGLFFGVLSIGMAFLAGNFDGVLAASIVLNGSVAGPLLGVFLMGILLPFTNKFGAIIGMLCGHTVTIYISIGGFLQKRKAPTLAFSTDTCSADAWSRVSNHTLMTLAAAANGSTSSILPVMPDEVPWPSKIFTVSFLLYPLIGCTVTIFVGIIVSLLTGGKKFTQDQEKYIHPLIVSIFRGSRNKKELSFSKPEEKEMHGVCGSYTLSQNHYPPASNNFESRTTPNYPVLPSLQDMDSLGKPQSLSNGDVINNNNHAISRENGDKKLGSSSVYDNQGFE